MITKEDKILTENLGNQEATVLGQWFGNFLIRTAQKQRGTENLLRKLRETGSADRLTGSGRPHISCRWHHFCCERTGSKSGKQTAHAVVHQNNCTMPQNLSDKCTAHYSWWPLPL